MLTALKKCFNDPREIIFAFNRQRLKAARQAVAKQLGGDLPGSVIEEIVFRDSVEPDRRPIDKESVTRRLFFNRVGLHMADRLGAKLRARDFALALVVFVVTLVVVFLVGGDAANEAAATKEIAELTGQQGVKVKLIAGSAAQIVVALWLVVIGLAMAWLSIGLSASGYKLFLPAGRFVEPEDVQDARDFAERVLLNSTPAGTPADLADVYRQLTVDAEGKAVDGQVVSQDALLSWARLAVEDGSYVRSAIGLSIAATGVMMFSEGLGAFLAPLVAAFMVVATAARLFLLPDVTRNRGLAAVEAVRRSPTARKVERQGSVSFKKTEEAKAIQNAAAAADETQFIKIGTSTGLFAERRDKLAPPQAGMPFGLSINDLATHLLVLGATGSGKTSGVLRPVLKSWVAADAGGVLVLDGKGVLPKELTGLPGFKIIKPGKDVFAPIENLTPDQVADALYESFGGKSQDPFWEKAACELIRAAAKTLFVCVAIKPELWKWTLGDLHRMIFESESIESAKLIFTAGKEDRMPLLPGPLRRAYVYLTETFPAMPAETANSIRQNASVWLGLLVNHSSLGGWADADTGVQIENVLSGARVGLLLPSAEFGQAGTVISNFAKKRFYKAVQIRGEDWKDPQLGQTRALLMIDECQLLVTETDEAEVLPVARSLGLCAVFATQNTDGFHAALGSRELTEQVLGQFMSVVALSVNTESSKAFVAARMGSTARVVYGEMPAAFADAQHAVQAVTENPGGFASSTLANQAHWNSEITDARAGGNFLSDTFEMVDQLAEKSGMKAAIQKIGVFSRQKDTPGTAKIGVLPLVEAGEIEELTIKPFTALAVVKRAGVLRRDLIELEPIFAFPPAPAIEKEAV